MESCLTFLEGSRTHARYDADVLQTLDPVDGAPLLARYDLGRVARTLNPTALAGRSGTGMWRWGELLPVRDPAHIVHLGEGTTPLLPATRLGGALGIDRLLVKQEGQNPTGSFKARGMAAAVSRARELGARLLIAPSAGNAGGALAAYGAAAGIPVTVVMPADTPTVNIVEAQVCGATVLLVEGVISDCGRVSRAIAAATGAFDVSTMKEPYRVEGKKTMGLELVEQLGWGVPDVIVYPTGGGTGLVGMWKAFDELEALGLIGSARPRMVAAQAEGCAPIVRAFQAGADVAEPWQDPATRASGLRVPSAVGDRLILDALRQSDGTAVAVPEDEIDAVQRLVGRRGSGYVSPESATAFAALAVLADDGWVSANERVVVFDCGIGHKYPSPPDLDVPLVVAADIAEDDEAFGRLVRALRGGTAVGRPVPEATTEASEAAPRRPASRVSALAGVMIRRRAVRRLEEAEAQADALTGPAADVLTGPAAGPADEPVAVVEPVAPAPEPIPEPEPEPVVPPVPPRPAAPAEQDKPAPAEPEPAAPAEPEPAAPAEPEPAAPAEPEPAAPRPAAHERPDALARLLSTGTSAGPVVPGEAPGPHPERARPVVPGEGPAIPEVTPSAADTAPLRAEPAPAPHIESAPTVDLTPTRSPGPSEPSGGMAPPRSTPRPVLDEPPAGPPPPPTPPPPAPPAPPPGALAPTRPAQPQPTPAATDAKGAAGRGGLRLPGRGRRRATPPAAEGRARDIPPLPRPPFREIVVDPLPLPPRRPSAAQPRRTR